MNIIFIASSSDWHIDAWVQYFTDKHNVYLFSDKEDYKKNMPYNGVTVIEVESYFLRILNVLKVKSHKIHQINKLFLVRHYAKMLDYYIKDLKIDVVHAHSLYYGYLCSYIESNVPVIFTPMGSDIIRHAQSNPLYKYMAQKAFSKANIITGDSFYLQEKGYNVGARKKNNYIIQNGVDTNVFYPKKNLISQKYGLKKNEILLFSPRGITPLYNIDIVVNSLNLLLKDGIKFKCMFSYPFGDEYSKSLKTKIQDYGLENNVIWLGSLSCTAMAEHYNAADIVVSIPSSDSSPKSVYEAMFCRKPVVVSDLMWSYELLDNTECLVRVPVRDSSKTYKAIKNLIVNKTYYERISLNANIEAHNNFKYRQNMEKMELIMLNAGKYT